MVSLRQHTTEEKRRATMTKGISYVCRYRLMDMLKKYFRRKRLIELDKKIAKAYLKIYQGDYSEDDDDWSEWDKRYGKYKWTKE